MSKIVLIFFLFIIFPYRTYAQKMVYIGKIIDKETLLPIENVTINIYKQNINLYRAKTDSLGVFKIPPVFLEGCDSIKIHSINYQELQADIMKRKSNANQYNLGTFKLKKGKILLKEVKIKSTKRYRDTTKIDLSKQQFERSVMIDELFSKNYGITKSANGQLYYKGKPISDVLINGGDFFGKNNLDIYHLLPALILDKIEVVETNIDSVTNVTMLRPTIIINLKLKEKYKKGKFGHINLGMGTSKRNLANTDLFSYKNNEQISLGLNANNLNFGDNTLLEPKVDFVANGNNLTTYGTKFTYRNLYLNKIEINFGFKGKVEDKNYISEINRQEENINLFSKILSTLNSKGIGINIAKVNISYKIDSLNTVDLTQTFEYLSQKESDSLNYVIKFQGLNSVSLLSKLRNTSNDLFTTRMNWQKKYNSKKGRLLHIEIHLSNNIYHVNEFDNVYNETDQNVNRYFINGKRSINEHKNGINLNFTEPINNNAYNKLFIGYQNHILDYKTQTSTDTIINNLDGPSLLNSNYFELGNELKKTFDRISFDATVTGIIDFKNTKLTKLKRAEHLFNLNVALRTDYKISKTKNLTLDYSGITNYPGIEQLTSLKNTFDIISQTSGNIFLKPEENKNIKLTYNVKQSDSQNIYLMGSFEHFDNKFGLNINRTANNLVQSTVINNVGSSNGGQILFSYVKTYNDNKFLNYSTGIIYQELPAIDNKMRILNNGITFNQSVSTSITIIESLLSTNPILGSSYSKYFYKTNTINIITFTYSDKLSLILNTFQINLYPLFNYNHSINNNESFSMNGEIKKNIFKDYGVLWIQAYDIFNSFKYINNYIGPSNFQSVKYSNLQRYFLIGISVKFNNMK